MNKEKYFNAVEMIELYECLQDIIDKLRGFDLNEVLLSHESRVMWLRQLDTIKEQALKADSMKKVLLQTATDQLFNLENQSNK